ncbi:MAG: alpha/beta hydrolase [Phycisphaerales bacterium]
MPTPVIYQGDAIDLMAMVPEARRSLDLNIFYATTRDRDSKVNGYADVVSTDLRVGRAMVRFGDAQNTWDALGVDCAVEKRAKPVILSLAGVEESATFPDAGIEWPSTQLDERQRGWFDAINAELDASPTHDIIVYVHGAKVNFYNGCVFAGEVDHFLGRRLVPVAFCWPTHQDIFSYIGGEDIGRGQQAAYALAGMLQQLADHTTARRIHIICWSAGGRVTSKALVLLREAYPYLDPGQLQARFRLGTVAFAAADVEVARFLNRIRWIDEITRRVIVTITDSDEALTMSRLTMGGDERIGVWRADSEDERQVMLSTEAVEVIDVSYLGAARGFDIDGHRYWFQHPWASSDLMMAILFDLPAAERGLAPGPLPFVWGMPPDYPQRVRSIVAPLANGRSAGQGSADSPARVTPDMAPAAGS